jgi:hypothetical protein
VNGQGGIRMGMYSTFLDQDIKIIDSKKLVKIKTSKGADTDYRSVISDDGKSINFEEWDSYKIEGYWYPELKTFLKKIATCIEGWAEFEYEEGYRFRIVFQNKTPYFLRERREWYPTMQNLNTNKQEKYVEAD